MHYRLEIRNSTTGAELEAAIKSIPSEVTSLDLSFNYLCAFTTGADLVKAVKAIPDSVTSLDLKANCLNKLTSDDLIKAVKAIPDSVTSLDLNKNSNILGRKTWDEFEKVMLAIPIHVAKVDLGEINLDKLNIKSKESSTSNISMQVLGGFIAVVGCAAVATAFILLNAATFGVAGLVVAGLGVASILAGAGLFAAGTYRNRQETPDEALNPVPRVSLGKLHHPS